TGTAGGNSVSRPPLKDKAFSTFLDQNPSYGRLQRFQTVELPLDRGTRTAPFTARLVSKGFCEYFDPLTGDGLGGGHFSWTAAIALYGTLADETRIGAPA